MTCGEGGSDAGTVRQYSTESLKVSLAATATREPCRKLSTATATILIANLVLLSTLVVKLCQNGSYAVPEAAGYFQRCFGNIARGAVGCHDRLRRPHPPDMWQATWPRPQGQAALRSRTSKCPGPRFVTCMVTLQRSLLLRLPLGIARCWTTIKRFSSSALSLSAWREAAIARQYHHATHLVTQI